MKVSKKLWLVTFILILGMLFAACTSDETTDPVEEVTTEETAVEVVEEEAPPPVEPEEEAVEEPVEEVEEAAEETPVEEEVVALAESELDALFAAFLADMVKYNTIGLDELNEQLSGDPAPFLLDVRQPDELEEKGHIEGAVNIPLRELGKNVEVLPDFDTPIVSYCGSGWRCTIAMTELGALGWEDILSLKGGSYGGWLEAGYPIVEGPAPAVEAANPIEVDPALVTVLDNTMSAIPEGWGGITAEQLNTELAENPDLILIDVRRSEELEENGVIEAANFIHIPLEEFIAEKDQWPSDKDAPVAVYCGSGHRSTMAMTALWNYGYENVRSLKGGFGGWVSEGYPTAGGVAALDKAYADFLAAMVKYNTIGLDEFNEQLIGDPPPFVLDVRQPEELDEKGHIEGAVNIPLRELGKNMNVMPSFDTPIVSYCGSGWRCTIAMTQLGALGWENVLSLKGGSYGGWLEAGYPIVEGPAAEPLVLDVASPDPNLLATIDEALSTIPEGWGVITAEQLNTELAENPDLIVIDVRRSEELEANGLIEAENFIPIPLEEFITQKDQWPAEKDASIAVYCGSGHRSTMAMAILNSYGYSDVRSLKGGFSGWVSEGYPVASGTAALDAAYADFLVSMVKYNTIGLDEFNEQLIGDPPPFVLDVRQPEELEEKGHIEGAVNRPLRELGKNVSVMPSFDTPIVSYCGSGWRCTIAMTHLGALGWENVLSLKGGSYGGWLEAGYPIVEGPAAEPLVLDVAVPEPALLATIDEALSTIPEGWGVITAEQLNTELAENPDLIVIDVRRTEELEENGVIEAANFTHIPLEEFVAQKDQWPADKDAPIAIYCGSGHRSTMAMAILNGYGYSDVRSLKGGFSGWVSEGYPVIEFEAVSS